MEKQQANSRTEYAREYAKQKYDNIAVLFKDKDEKEKFQAYAESQGLTLTEWIRKVVYKNIY